MAPKILGTEELDYGLDRLDRAGEGDLTLPVNELPYCDQPEDQYEAVEKTLQGSPVRRRRGILASDVRGSARFGNNAHRDLTPCLFVAADVVPKCTGQSLMRSPRSERRA